MKIIAMKRLVLCLSILFFSFSQSFSQYYDPDKVGKSQQKAPGEKSDFWSKVYPGGNVSFGFGSYTYINLSPLVGYNFNERFTAGLMGTYIYFKYSYGSYSYSSNVFGLSPFARFFVTENLFLHGEVDFLNSDVLYQNTSGSYYIKREWNPFPMLGGGYIVRFGERTGFTITALYNFNYKNPASFYGPLVLRAGFIF